MIRFITMLFMIQVSFMIIWNYIVLIPLLLIVGVLKLNVWATRTIKLFGIIVLASLISSSVLMFATNPTEMIVYSLIALTYMLLNLVSGTYSALNKINRETNFIVKLNKEVELSYDYVYWILSIVFFLIVLVLLVGNTEWLFGIIFWLPDALLSMTHNKILNIIALISVGYIVITGISRLIIYLSFIKACRN